MRGFALLELLMIVFILGVLVWIFTRAGASLFAPGTPQQAQEGESAVKQAQQVTQQFNGAAGREQSSTNGL